MKAAIFCGDRNWTDSATIGRTIDRIRPDVIIEGEARGADQLSRLAAELRGYEVLKEGELIRARTIIPVPAEWKRYRAGAGPKRNTKMLEILLALRSLRESPFFDVLVVAFHADLANSRGTANMVVQAEIAGILVEVVTGENS